MKVFKNLITFLLCLTILFLFGCKNLNNANNTNVSNGNNGNEDSVTYSKNLQYGLASNQKSYVVLNIGACDDQTLIIPSTYNNLPVSAIDSNAFKNNENITSVYIPKTVTAVKENAFSGCVKLRNVIFYGNSTISVIDNYAFNNCESLEAFNFPSSIKIIGEYAFSGCKQLNSVTYDSNSSLEEIKAYAFNNCVILTGMRIPKTVKYIDETAFTGCKNLITSK